MMRTGLYAVRFAGAILLAFSTSISLIAQHTNPVIRVGNAFPDFELTIGEDSSSRVSLRDYRGKPLILTFLSMGCVGSFSVLPKLKPVTEEFASRIEFLLVAKDEGKMRSTYKKYASRYKLDFDIAFDTALHRMVGITGVPYFIWVDGKGIVRGTTFMSELTSKDMEAFSRGEDVNLIDRSATVADSFDIGKPLLIDNNGGSDSAFLFRSLLFQWDQSIPRFNPPWISIHTNVVQFTRLSIDELYMKAYGDTVLYEPHYHGLPDVYLKSYPKALLRVKDAAPFKTDFPSTTNLYCYSAIFPAGTKPSARQMQKTMQLDLEKYFGYRASVKKTNVGCWKLVATRKARKTLASRGGKPVHIYRQYADFEMMNLPVSHLVNTLRASHTEDMPIIDRTGIRTNIDLHVDAFLTDDLETIRKSLVKHGLDLVKTKRRMKAVIIKDPES